MIKTAVRRSLAPLAGARLGRAAGRLFQKGPAILVYHGVSERVVDPWVEQLHLPVEVFEQQVAYLGRHYEVVGLGRIAEALSAGERPDPGWVVVTFDDGYRNVAKTAAPIMRSLGLPFTVSISTHHVETGERFPTYVARAAFAHSPNAHAELASLGRTFELRTRRQRVAAYQVVSAAIKRSSLSDLLNLVEEIRALVPEQMWRELDDRFTADAPLTWADVEELTNSGATIASHAHHHTVLHDGETTDEMQRQLLTSRELIRQHVGRCDYVAYPNGMEGDVCDRTLAATKSAGYTLGMTAVPGEVTVDSNPLLLPRYGVARTVSVFRLLLSARFVTNRRYRAWASTLGESLNA